MATDNNTDANVRAKATAPRRIHYQWFHDHADCIALSAAYPVRGSMVAELGKEQKRQPGTIETRLGYPCVSVYVPTSSSVLDTKRKQSEMKRWVRQIFLGLHGAAFFEAFRGIRFEIFDGRPGFAPRLGDGELDGLSFESVARHYREEREHRNALQIVRANLAVHESRDFEVEIRKAEFQGNKDDLRRVQDQHRQSLKRICRSAALVCAEFAKFSAWMETPHVKVSTPIRRKTMSDLDPNREPPQFKTRRRYTILWADRQPPKLHRPKRSRRASACGQYAIDCKANLFDHHEGNADHRTSKIVQQYVSLRLGKLIRNIKSRYHAAIEPYTFVVPGSQPWSSLIVALPQKHVLADDVKVYLFDKELSYEDMVNGHVQFSSCAETVSLTVSIGSDQQVMTRDYWMTNGTSLAKVIEKFLFELGYCRKEDWNAIV